ncbi:hypothetical protein CASFOL_019657 [Castilleja foliolosa]|uniref:F-box domain-containing protein n=1 Tax=Castilleja foliolosa TaxID=1961234 RepID=A0ABD3D507_9LAMI
MANSVLPEELMLCILTRLPVKTIIRFKSVCKPWYDLFSTPEFKKMHQAQFSSDPKNESVIVHRYTLYCSEPKNQFSIFNTDESAEKRPTILDHHPFDHAQEIDLYTAGCCNGLVCIHGGHEFALWNPAMKLSKTVPLKGYRHLKNVELGFGYDAIGDDFKVVMIATNVHGEGKTVEIYSVNLDSWITIDVGFEFRDFEARSYLIINGNPYWVAWVDENKVLLCFDVLDLVLKIVPLPMHYWNGWNGETVRRVDLNGLDVYIKTEKKAKFDLVDWNGALGVLITNLEFEHRSGPAAGTECSSSRIDCVQLWVFDDIGQIWRKIRTFGPIEVNVDGVLLYRKNEKIMGIFLHEKVFVVDLETGCVKELFDRAHVGDFFDLYGYTESLAHINGMQKVVVTYERNNLYD